MLLRLRFLVSDFAKQTRKAIVFGPIFGLIPLLIVVFSFKLLVLK